jgi:hypothetical protein
MGKKNNSYTASYKLKVEKFRGTVREPCGTERIRNSGIQHALLEETKRIIKEMKKVTVGHFVVRKLEKPHILRTPIFQRPN